MALRYLSIVLALGLVMTSGCRTGSNYHPCQPAVVAPTPCPAPCPTAVPPPPGAPIIIPR
jgi:hypothetical protein